MTAHSRFSEWILFLIPKPGDKMTLGNVEFSNDGTGQYSYSIPVAQWDQDAVSSELHKRLFPPGWEINQPWVKALQKADLASLKARPA